MSDRVWHWFLSFRDADDNRSLGGCHVVVISDSPDMQRAVDLAWELGCNPGGEVMGFTAEGSDPRIADAVRGTPPGKLFSRDQVARYWEPFGIRAGRVTLRMKED